MRRYRNKHRPALSGFSLVELSIVLVILGLLVGGIMTGQNLIRAAELRAITTEMQQYQTAANLFQEKYFALPGDMGNATSFWPGDTDDGDGDGLVEHGDTANDYAEMFTFWQHLALAGLINGEFTGEAGPETGSYGAGTSDGEDAILGENSPRSKLSNAGWSVSTFNWDSTQGGSTSTTRFQYNYQNALAFGATEGSGCGSTCYTNIPILTPEEAWNIDTKIDDGNPGRGNVIGYPYAAAGPFNGCTDASAQDEFDSEYQLAEKGKDCAFYFMNAL